MTQYLDALPDVINVCSSPERMPRYCVRPSVILDNAHETKYKFEGRQAVEEMLVKRKRITLALKPEQMAFIEQLAAERGMSQADVVRMGLALLIRARQARRDGYEHVGAWRDDHKRGVRIEREFDHPALHPTGT